MRLPTASFISMVDAILCAVSMFIVMIVVLPRTSLRPGHLPRAEITVRCEARSPVDMTITATATPQAGAGRVEATAEDEPQATILAVRAMLVAQLRRLDAISARLAVLAGTGKYAPLCLDLMVCAVERRDRACRIQDIVPWKLMEGEPIPIVSVLYGDADVFLRE